MVAFVVGAVMVMSVSWVLGLPVDREQRQTEIAKSLEQAVQGCLVGHEAVDDGGAVGAVGEGHPLEPGSPPRVESPLKADFVPG
jgi:hypothetical protein